MAVEFSIGNDQSYVSRDSIEAVAFMDPDDQNIHLVLLGDNIAQISGYVITPEYFRGADGLLYPLKKEAVLEILCWSNQLSRFAKWIGYGHLKRKVVCQVVGHNNTVMWNEKTHMHVTPIGQGRGGMSMHKISLVNTCPRSQIYKDNDLLADLPWIDANINVVSATEHRLYYDRTDIPCSFYFTAAPTWSSSNNRWECAAAGNLFIQFPWAHEGSTVVLSGNGTGVLDSEWDIRALDINFVTISGNAANDTPYVCPTGTRYLQVATNNLTTAKSIEQPMVQVISHGSTPVVPEAIVEPRDVYDVAT